MSGVRSFLPTDLPALVAYSGLSSENDAWPRERLGAGEAQATLSVVRDQLLSFARRRGAWISVHRQRLQGLVGTRQRGGAEAWEIDYLVDTTKDRRVAVELLEYATMEAGKEGAHKLFLRLAADSDLLRSVREAGFSAYQEETLYARVGGGITPPADMRQVFAADAYPLFRLYCQSIPETTRRLEAATFAEWHSSQEKRWLKNGVQLVLEEDGRLQAQVRAGHLPQGLMVELTVAADGSARAPSLVSAACLAAESAGEPVFVLVPDTAEGISRALLDAGYTPQNSFVSLVRRTAKPLTMPKKVAVVAENAVGV
jgi:hypothetical protein